MGAGAPVRFLGDGSHVGDDVERKGIGMMFMMLVFWGLAIVGLMLGFRWLVTQGRESRSDTALDILRQRYAHGEFDKEEFEARKRDLN
jgi:putative membrane protein